MNGLIHCEKLGKNIKKIKRNFNTGNGLSNGEHEGLEEPFLTYNL